MKRMILTGMLALATGFIGLTAQTQSQPQGQPQAQPPGQPQAKIPTAKSKEEQAAVFALNSAQSDPDATIKAAEELMTKFADTEFKELALLMEARAYQMKGDADRAQIFGERVLEVNPKNFQAMLMVGESLVQHTRENDLDKEEKLGKSERYLNQAREKGCACSAPLSGHSRGSLPAARR